MSDERLRELERRWKETGAVEDEAKFLAERVRVGDLTKERLELAAYCGHRAASIAHGPISIPGSGDDWLSGLKRWARAYGRNGADITARARLACARSLLPVWKAKFPQSNHLGRAIDAAERALTCPCILHIREALELEYAAASGPSATDEDLSKRHAQFEPQWADWKPDNVEAAAIDAAHDVASAVLGSIECYAGRAATAEDTRLAASEFLAPWTLATNRSR